MEVRESLTGNVMYNRERTMKTDVRDKQFWIALGFTQFFVDDENEYVRFDDDKTISVNIATGEVHITQKY